IPSPDWSKDLFLKNDPWHGTSKRIGGGSVILLATLIFPGPAAGEVNVVRAYRVESLGGFNEHLLIDDAGNVVVKELDRMMHLNFGSRARAEEFLARRLSEGHPTPTCIKSFDVDETFVGLLRRESVTQAEARKFPGVPQRVDQGVVPDQYGIPKEW